MANQSKVEQSPQMAQAIREIVSNLRGTERFRRMKEVFTTLGSLSAKFYIANFISGLVDEYYKYTTYVDLTIYHGPRSDFIRAVYDAVCQAVTATN